MSDLIPNDKTKLYNSIVVFYHIHVLDYIYIPK